MTLSLLSDLLEKLPSGKPCVRFDQLEVIDDVAPRTAELVFHVNYCVAAARLDGAWLITNQPLPLAA